MRTDEELWRAWVDGDRSAGDDLVARYFLGVFRFFRAKVHAAADELTQATFLGCVEGRGRIRDGRFRPFLFGIARNKLRQHFERRGRSVDADTFSRMSVADLAPSPSRALGQAELRERVIEALRMIPLDHQIVIELTYWERMPLDEVAEVVGAPAGTIKSRLSRARANLADRLAELGVADAAGDVATATMLAAAGLEPG